MTDYHSRLYERYLSVTQHTPFSGCLDTGPSREFHLKHFIAAYVPKNLNASILDLGCGHGTLLNFMRQAGYTQLEGIDMSQEQISLARELGTLGVRKGNLLSELTEMSDNSRQVIVTFDVIEHFSKSELIHFADEIHRVLAPAGSWLIHTVNAASPLSGRLRYGDLTHELAFTSDSITQLLLSSGFTRVECFEDAPVAHGVVSLARALLWKLLRIRIRLTLAIESGAWDRFAILSQTIVAVGSK
jgi:SAM-dependent methyltransferase